MLLHILADSLPGFSGEQTAAGSRLLQRGLCRPLVPHPRGAGRQGRPAGPLCGSKPIRLPSTLARTAQKQPTHAVHWASVLGAARAVPGGVGDAQMSTLPVRDAVVTVSLTSGGGSGPVDQYQVNEGTDEEEIGHEGFVGGMSAASSVE